MMAFFAQEMVDYRHLIELYTTDVIYTLKSAFRPMIKEIVKPIPSLVNMTESVTENVLTSYVVIDWSVVIVLSSATIIHIPGLSDKIYDFLCIEWKFLLASIFLTMIIFQKSINLLIDRFRKE